MYQKCAIFLMSLSHIFIHIGRIVEVNYAPYVYKKTKIYIEKHWCTEGVLFAQRHIKRHLLHQVFEFTKGKRFG